MALPFGDLPCNHDVCRDFRGGGNVAAGELNSKRFALIEKPTQEAVNPGLRRSAGSPRERKQASGSPPMAAMSLSPRARQRWPTAAAGCHARRKCTSSTQRSVVTSNSYPGERRRMAQSSPMPWITPFAEADWASRRICAIKASFVNHIKAINISKIKTSMSGRTMLDGGSFAGY